MAWSRSSIQLTSLQSQRRCLNKMPVWNKRSTHLSEVWSCYTPSLGLQWTKRSPLCLRLDSHLGSMLPECQPRQLWSYKYIHRRMRQLRGLGVLVSFSGCWRSIEDMLGESGRCINGTFRSNLRQQRSALVDRWWSGFPCWTISIPVIHHQRFGYHLQKQDFSHPPFDGGHGTVTCVVVLWGSNKAPWIALGTIWWNWYWRYETTARLLTIFQSQEIVGYCMLTWCLLFLQSIRPHKNNYHLWAYLGYIRFLHPLDRIWSPHSLSKVSLQGLISRNTALRAIQNHAGILGGVAVESLAPSWIKWYTTDSCPFCEAKYSADAPPFFWWSINWASF